MVGLFCQGGGLPHIGIQWIHGQSKLLHNLLSRTLYLSKQHTVLLKPLYLNRSPYEH